MRTLHTIGYEAATVDSFLDLLQDAEIQVLVDVRAAARSRRPGFAKTALSNNLKAAGIEYLHLRGLGTPADGRAAARAGDPKRMKQIYRDHLPEPEAQEDLAALLELIENGRKVCLLCLEDDPQVCHRSIVADEVAKRVEVRIQHLFPNA